ncbi:MAG: prefoldin subunit alpha [Candidatus Diapherotrites archaeon]
MMAEKKEIKLTGQQAVRLFESEKAKMGVVQRKMESIQGIISELNNAILALEEINKIKSEAPFLVPLGAGVYVEAKLENTKNAKHSLAGSIMIDEKVEEIVKKLNSQRKDALQNMGTLQKEGQALSSNLNNLGMILNQMNAQQNAK